MNVVVYRRTLLHGECSQCYSLSARKFVKFRQSAERLLSKVSVVLDSFVRIII